MTITAAWEDRAKATRTQTTNLVPSQLTERIQAHAPVAVVYAAAPRQSWVDRLWCWYVDRVWPAIAVGIIAVTSIGAVVWRIVDGPIPGIGR